MTMALCDELFSFVTQNHFLASANKTCLSSCFGNKSTAIFENFISHVADHSDALLNCAALTL